jgi:hypothetical protein
MFGSSGHLTHDPGLVIERFTRCAPRGFRGNRAIKTLARLDTIEVPRVHTCHFAAGVEYQTVLGERIPPSAGTSRIVSHDIIRINHYFTRSREEWDVKAARGRGAKPAHHPRKHRNEREFYSCDRNDDEDTQLLSYVQEINEFIDCHASPRATSS